MYGHSTVPILVRHYRHQLRPPVGAQLLACTAHRRRMGLDDARLAAHAPVAVFDFLEDHPRDGADIFSDDRHERLRQFGDQVAFLARRHAALDQFDTDKWHVSFSLSFTRRSNLTSLRPYR